MKQQTFFERIHVDVPLLCGLLVLCAFGLVILYSASGQEISTVYQQATRMGMAFVLMIAIAQLTPTQMAAKLALARELASPTCDPRIFDNPIAYFTDPT